MSLLSNSDSVLGRDGVKECIEGYEGLFSGARKQVGTTSSSQSIENREKEYATMVNSFYDLVTDFYEWGWGQVSTVSALFFLLGQYQLFSRRLCSLYLSPFILHLDSLGKHSLNRFTDLSIILR